MCVDCVQPPVFGKSIFNGVPFPTCNCHVSGSDRTVILKRNFCDHARVLKCTGRNECQSASTFSGGLGAIKFVSKGLSDQALFSAANDWRSQQWMNWRLVVYGWNRVAEPKRGLDGSNGSGELPAIHYVISQSIFASISLSFFGENPIIIQNEQIRPLQFGQGALSDISATLGSEPKRDCRPSEDCGEKRNVSVWPIESVNPPSIESTSDGGDRASKNAAIFFFGLIGGGIFSMLTKSRS